MWDSRGDRGEDGRASLKHAACRSLYGYWDLLRAGRPAPCRREIEPADLGRILSDTFVLEAIDRSTYPYRLAGTRVGAYFGRELKGENWLAAWTPADREPLAIAMRAIVYQGAAAAVEFDGRNADGQSAPFETLMLPLVNRGVGFTRVLCATLPLDEPYWLGAYPVTDLELIRTRLIWQSDTTLDVGSVANSRFGASRPLRRHRHLALYDGGVDD